MEIPKNYQIKPKKEKHLHSPAHVLAEELRLKFNEPHNYKFYFGVALRTDHRVIRRIVGEVFEKPVENPAALFAYKIKKYNEEQKAKENNSSQQ
jgi:hypothetical protein